MPFEAASIVPVLQVFVEATAFAAVDIFYFLTTSNVPEPFPA
jgi:hypothetical protein